MVEAPSQRGLEEKFPAQNPYPGQVVFSDGEALTRPATRTAVTWALEGPARLPHVVADESPATGRVL